MYKPVPLLSNQGYGLLFNTTARITADLGTRYHSAASAYIDDDEIDIVLFCGDPKDILSAYTQLSGRSRPTTVVVWPMDESYYLQSRR